MKKTGFTIIEMLVVMSIIGALALLILPHFINARFKADLTSCIANEKRISQSLETRRNDKGEYPDKLITLKEENIFPYTMPVCPSNGVSYENSYEVSDDRDRYTLSCPGIHYKLLNYKKGYPQFSSAYGLQLLEK